MKQENSKRKCRRYENQCSRTCVACNTNCGNKFEFYIGLMDKDTYEYKYSIEDAKLKVFEVVGDCTIFETKGSYRDDEGKLIIMDTLVATKYAKGVHIDYVHKTVERLKEIFNQKSILTVENCCKLEFNDESEEEIRYIKSLMKEYNWSWEVARDTINTGYHQVIFSRQHPPD